MLLKHRYPSDWVDQDNFTDFTLLILELKRQFSLKKGKKNQTFASEQTIAPCAGTQALANGALSNDTYESTTRGSSHCWPAILMALHLLRSLLTFPAKKTNFYSFKCVLNSVEQKEAECHAEDPVCRSSRLQSSCLLIPTNRNYSAG